MLIIQYKKEIMTQLLHSKSESLDFSNPSAGFPNNALQTLVLINCKTLSTFISRFPDFPSLTVNNSRVR